MLNVQRVINSYTANIFICVEFMIFCNDTLVQECCVFDGFCQSALTVDLNNFFLRQYGHSAIFILYRLSYFTKDYNKLQWL